MAASFAPSLNGSAKHLHGHSNHGHNRSAHRKAAPNRISASINPSPLGIEGLSADKTYGNDYSHAHTQSVPLASWNGSARDGHQHTHSLNQQAHSLNHKSRNTFNSPKPIEKEDVNMGNIVSGDGHVLSHKHSDSEIDAEVRSRWLSPIEALTALLIPLPFVLTSFVLTSKVSPVETDMAMKKLMQASINSGSSTPFLQKPLPYLSFSGVCSITATTLVLIGFLGEIQGKKENTSGNRRSQGSQAGSSQDFVSVGTIQRILGRILSVGLPFYAISKLGGETVAIVVLVAFASDLMSARPKMEEFSRLSDWKKLLLSKKWTIAIMVLQFLANINGLTTHFRRVQAASGYLALAISLLLLPLPYPTRIKSYGINSPRPNSRGRHSPVLANRPLTGGVENNLCSPMISTPRDTDLTVASGVLATVITFIVFIMSSQESQTLTIPLLLGGSAVALLSACSLVFVDARSLKSSKKVGVALGLVLSVLVQEIIDSHSKLALVSHGGLATLFWFGTYLDTPSLRSRSTHSHHSHGEHSTHSHDSPHSKFTSILLSATNGWPLLNSILVEKDSRRILYFMCLNFGFMLVQTFYGLVTGSLGLLSDSIHMFFDCLALVVGLCAAVMSKWPPSLRFPYGFGKMDTLAGFANGVFLMLISIEIIYEAVERLREGSEMQRIGELLTVSSLGLAVNLVGMFAFGHAHHGHGHSHGGQSHSHGDHDHSVESHDHKHDSHNHDHHDHHAHHEHSHTNSAGHPDLHSHQYPLPSPGLLSPLPFTTPPAFPNPPAPAPAKAHSHGHSHGHHHDHGNENMHGIFLHVLADTLGSVAVVISTIMIHYTGWSGFDPIASALIAILIFASAVPLVSSSARRLLLTIPESTEFDLRETLAGVSALRGVTNVCAPRFWLSEGEDPQVEGVMHVVVGKGVELDDVRERALAYLYGRGMDVVVQVEREGEGRCWCGGGMRSM